MVKQFLILNTKRLVVCLLMSVHFLTDISAQVYQPRIQDPYPARYRQSSSQKQETQNAYPSRNRQSSSQNQRAQDAYPSRYRQGSSQNQRDQDAYPSRYRQSSTQNKSIQDGYSSNYRQSSSQYQRNGSTRREYSNPFMKQDKNNNSSKTEKSSKRSAKSEEDAKQTTPSISNNKSADDVELIVTGEGRTKDDATKIALRSAIEQAFGTFVSSNTNILNDELVKDEIVTVSSGNVKKYSILSENEENGKWNVTVQATISIGGLVKYVQSKGAEAELAGAAFAMNVRMKELNRKNQETALRNLQTQLKELFSKSFDYEVEVGEPRERNHHYYVPIIVTVKANKNAEACYQLYHKTLSALSSYSRGEANVSKIIVFKSNDHNRTAPIKEYYLCANPSSATSYLESIMLDCICNFTLSDGGNEYVGNYDYNHNSPRVHLLYSKTKEVFETADRFIKKSGPLLISHENDYGNVPFLPIIANSNYAGNIITQFKFEFGYGLEQISKLSSFKVRPNNSKE